MPTGKVYAHHIHCGLQAKRWPGQNLSSGEGQSSEATTRREKLSLLLSGKKICSFLDQYCYKNIYSLSLSLFLSLSLSPSLLLYSLTFPPHQILAGASDRLLGDLQLIRDTSKYRYLSGTKQTTNDEQMYSEVLKSMMV